MIDHIGIDVCDLEIAKAFYTAALAPLGIEIIMEISAEQSGSGDFIGMGAMGKPFFWFGQGQEKPTPNHIAFTAQSRADVEAFYHAALKAGGQDNGAPGLRPHYHPDYFGAFVIDPEGNNIEAVCHMP